MEDLDRIIQHIYEDNVLGKLSDSRYLKLSRQYEKEQAEIDKLAAVLEREIEEQSGQVFRCERVSEAGGQVPGYSGT